MLPDAITRSYDHDPRLKSSLREPLEDSLGDAIRRDPHKFADALFPVIGPAIRKAIAEALKSLVQSFNRAAETSLSPTARYKAWRAGVPLGEWVLRNSLVYRVDEVYLIDPQSGRLIEHVSHEEAPDKDEDAISAMLTAIQDFVRDSFTHGESALDSAAIGEFTVWISHGPRAMLAAVVRGTPPSQLRPLLDSTLESVHLNYARALRAFDGVPIRGVDAELEACLLFRLRDEARDAARMSWPLRLFLVAIVGLLAWWLVDGYLLDRKLQRFGDALRSEPGIIVTQLERDGRRFVAAGLRDPLAAEPLSLAAQAELDTGRIAMDFRPFQSLDADILLARARQILDPPATVDLDIENAMLTATGSASVAWRQRARTLAAAIPGVEAADVSGVRPDDAELLARLRSLSNPPQGVTLAVNNGVASAAGVASARWIAGLEEVASGIEGLQAIETTGLGSSEDVVLRRLAAEIHGQSVFFSDADLLAPEQRLRVSRLAAQITLFGRNAEALGLRPALIVRGYTDDSGSLELNRQLQITRALALSRLLAEDGVDPAWLSAQQAVTVGEGGVTVDPAMRRATIEVATSAPDGGALVTP